MATILRFVNSIASSPTVRLDLNDGSTWTMRDFNAPPPRLRRAMGQNTMRDGGHVSSSLYDMRMLMAGLNVKTATADASATQLQLLARELDREENYLMYQAEGMTKPVFFCTKRSDFSALTDTRAQPAFRVPTIDILAEPFALGLRETLGPFTVNNDPAAGSNGHFFDVSGVIGDVAAPCVVVNTGTHRGGGWLAVRQRGTPSDLGAFWWVQAESCTLVIDTTNPGGGPDAAMSGTGTNNYVRTSFTTNAALNTRISRSLASMTDLNAAEMVGRWRVLAVVRRNDATSVMTAQAQVAPAVPGAVFTIPATTSRQVLDLGVFQIGPQFSRVGVYNSVNARSKEHTISLAAGRSSGSGTLDWDYVLLMPADEASMIVSGAPATTDELVIDGLNESVYEAATGVDIFVASSALTYSGAVNVAGSFPELVPNQTNRFFALFADDTAGTWPVVKGDVGTVSIHYWPRYLNVRPSAT